MIIGETIWGRPSYRLLKPFTYIHVHPHTNFPVLWICGHTLWPTVLTFVKHERINIKRHKKLKCSFHKKISLFYIVYSKVFYLFEFCTMVDRGTATSLHKTMVEVVRKRTGHKLNETTVPWVSRPTRPNRVRFLLLFPLEPCRVGWSIR